MEYEKLKEKFKGVQPVLITPFNVDESLDEDGLRQNVESLAKSGVHVLIPLGSTGEFYSLNIGECKRVMEIVVNAAKGKVPVVVGTHHSGTRVTVELSKHAEDVGADGVMIVPPYYMTPTDQGLLEHYRTVAEAIKIGIVLYHNPSTSKVTVGPGLLDKLLKIDNIVGLKGGWEVIPLGKRFGDRLSLTCGQGEVAAPYFLKNGIMGFISAFSNISPKMGLEMYSAAMKNDFEKVMEIHSKLLPFWSWRGSVESKKVGTCGKPILYPIYYKAAMNILGIPAGPPRKPLLPIDEDETEGLKIFLKNIGLLK